MAEKRYFALRTSPSGRELAVYTGRQPRQAALKAASRGVKDIFLRERGTKKLHHFVGTRIKVRAPADRPDWMAPIVWKPNVKKVGIIHMEKPKKKAVKKKKAKKRKTVKRKAKKKKKVVRKKKTVRKKARTKKKTVRRKAPKRKARRRR